MTTCVERTLVDRHFRGSLAPRDEQRLRAHLPECSSCTEHYDKWLILSQIDSSIPGPEERLARALGITRPRRGQMIVAGLAVAASVLLGLRSLSERSRGDEVLTARGSVDVSAPTELLVYRTSPGQGPSLATTRLSRNDELSFAYTNPEHKRYAIVFGVDSTMGVHWYYPAWTRTEEDPSSIEALTSGGSHDLPDAIRHDFTGETLTIHAVFSDTPIHVRTVERRIAARGPLANPGDVVVTRTFSVAP